MTKNKNITILCALLILILGCKQEDKRSDKNLKKDSTDYLEIEHKVDSLLNELYQSEKLNGNVLVVKEGKTLYENSFGFADASRNIKLTKEYRFNIGSIYKEFPAVAIMQLKEKNMLKLGDKISKYLPDLPSWAKQISIKNLLQYSSGLPMIQWGKYFGKGLEIRDEDIDNDLQDIKSLEFAPGSDYLYTNNTPVLLMKIVESITSTNFNAYLTENLLIPANMDGTITKGEYPYIDKSLMAIPFNSNFEVDNYNLSVSNVLFSSTARDMNNWFNSLGDFNILNKESIKFLSETVISVDNIQAPLGYCEWENENLIEHTHHGSMGNYECLVQRFKQEKLTIIILTNQKQKNVHGISSSIYQIVQNQVQ
jgi:CubicO group peptidase (beta-lactamase class C family)